MGNSGYSGSGGGAAGYHAIIYLDKNLNVIVGSGGVSSGATKGGVPSAQTNGEASVITSGETTITAGGGSCGSAWFYGCTAGAGGTVSSSNVENYGTIEEITGKNGSSNGINVTSYGGAGPISGHNWGAGGSAGGSAGGGNVSEVAKHGYIKIVARVIDE